MISLFLAIALTPVVNRLDRGRFPRWAAILTVYLAMVLSIFGVGLAVVRPVVNGVNDLVHNLPGYVKDLNKNKQFRKYDAKYHIVNSLEKEANKLPSRISDASGTLRAVTVGVFTKIVQLITVLVITFLLILDGRRIAEWVFRQLDPERERRARKVATEINRSVVGYVVGNVLISVVAGIITWITLKILGVPFAVPPVLIVYQQFENHLIQPIIYGRTVQLHPLLVIVAILTGGALLGVLGALLAIPAAAAVQIFVKDWWEHRPQREPAALPAEGHGSALPLPD